MFHFAKLAQSTRGEVRIHGITDLAQLFIYALTSEAHCVVISRIS